MGMIRDCLSLVFHSNSFHDVWLLKECGNEESWIKLIRLPSFGDKLKWVVYDSKSDTTK